MAAGRKIVLRLIELFATVCLLFAAQTVWAQEPQASATNQSVIARIEFVGNRRVATDTLRGRITSRPGDPYDPDALRRDFEALWNSQFFDDIRLVVEDSPNNPNAKIVIFYVTERPIIRRIEYCEGAGTGCGGLKTITESDILDAYKDKKVDLTVESQFDPTKVTRAAVVIKELLAAHGRQFATVKPTYEKIPASEAVKLVFHIDEGPTVKVGTITIKGNKAFSDKRIIRTMRNDRPYAIPLYFTYIPIMPKTFDRPKLDEDIGVGIMGLYQDNGYFRTDVNVTSTKTVDVNKGGIPGPWPFIGAKHEKATNITLTIDEGQQYHMGTLNFRTADPDEGLVFSLKVLATIFPMKSGDIFSTKKLRDSFKSYKDLYGEYGYIDFTPDPRFDIDDTKKVVNLTLVMDQEKQYYVRRINFEGNTTTRDKVIRRELLLDEGQVFNQRYWDLSILRLNQLNYFDKIKPEDAELKRNTKTGSVDILVKLKEKQKQSISFSGGVSGLAGSFVGLSYQTNNFLGLGETLTVSAQVGDIQKSILFGFTEPYLFDRPISSGFTIYDNEFNYNTARETGLLLGTEVAINPALQENYSNATKGFTAFASYPMRKFSFARLGLTYGWSTTNITAFSQSAQLLFEYTQFRSLAGPSALDGIRESYVMPSLTYNRVDSPINPTHGTSYSLSERFEGGPLQGNVNSTEEIFTISHFRPTYHKRNVIALHFQGATISGYGGKNAPPYNKFYMGGEYDIRGFEAFTISPFVAIPNLGTAPITYTDPTKLGSNGQPTNVLIDVPTLQYVPTRPGGDSQAYANMEYRIPIYQQGNAYVGMSIFNDIGVDGILWQNQLSLDPSAVTTLQQEYPNPDFPNLRISSRLPIISGTNFAPHGSAGLELDLQLPIIQAPFRFYWAYNYARLNNTIEGPLITDASNTALPGAYYLSDSQKSALPYGVLQTQIVPELEQYLRLQQLKLPSSLIEEKSVFRFTVSRTF
ncbi:MAG TPA: outer membrane protein assembly factor BamA [Candidatus Acidoferrum sp.]|nr:outer membrane protein assembly factor BamA [Candidatus Acidoferrum sp.]